MRTVLAMVALGLLAGCASQTVTAPVTSVAVGVEGPRGYICTDGQLVMLDHDRPAGIVRATRGDENFVLQEQVGVSPPRFVTGSDTVIFSENQIFLQRGKDVRQTCTRVPAAPEAGTVWGTVTKLDRMALPAGTTVKVLLVDAARADAPHVEIASTTIVTAGNQVPLHFLISYARTAVSPRAMTYRLQARIDLPGGQLGWITDTATFVLETDAPQPPVELQLVRVGAPAQ